MLADIPVPARLTHPANAAEAWNVIRLVVGNAGRLFAEDRVGETKEQFALLGPSLRVLSQEGALEGRQAMAEEIATQAFGRVNGLVRESMAGNLEGARSLYQGLQQDLLRLAEAFPAGLPESEIFSCVDHPELALPEAGGRCPECGKGLRPRRFPYSVIFANAGEPTLRLDMKSHDPLRMGEPNPIDLRLVREDEEPVGPDDLVMTHSRRLHVLLVDQAGSDFHHLAPEPGNEPGTFTTAFVPASPASYRCWVMAVPAETRLTEMLSWPLPGSVAAEVESTPPDSDIDGWVAGNDAVVVRLMAPGTGPLRIEGGETNLVQVHVARPDGTPLKELEPLWNAFVHLTLISWDFETAHQVHAVGGEILGPELRGGPDFSFKLHPPRPGWWRLYLQLRLDGRTMTFALRIRADE